MTDPRVDKLRIERTKGGFLFDSFCWILENPEFRDWRYNDQSRLLWIKGDAGKGKTMLLIGIINELLQKEAQSKQSSDGVTLSYFLCQGTDSRLNNATAILRGIIYLLIIQQPSLVSHLREKHDHAGRRLFEHADAFFSLSEVLHRMLQNPRLNTVYFIVDALDECEFGLPHFLDFITQTASDQLARVKWLVSSRNRYDIEQRFRHDDLYTNLSLELNAKNISQAVDVYVNQKVSDIVSLKDDQVLQERVSGQLRRKSDGTFLWVALVIDKLRDVLGGDILELLDKIPSGLTPFYDRMMKQIQQLRCRDIHRCLLALSAAAIAYRPLHLLELQLVAGLQENITRLVDLKGVISIYSSFLTIRDNYIYFIHQTAKDYLITNASTMIFPEESRQIHYNIFLRSRDSLSKSLRKNIYDLQDPGATVKDIEDFRPDPDPLTALRYSCAFWLDHLCELGQSPDNSNVLTDNENILTFFKNHFLHWLESLSLIGEVSQGVLMIRKLLHRVQVCRFYRQLGIFWS